MNKNIEIIFGFRRFLLSKIETLTVEQLNMIPEHFNNNIIWNIGHMTAVVNGLCYRNSGLPAVIDENYIHPFLSGTKPKEFINEYEINIMKQQFINIVSRLNTDLESGVFEHYKKAEKIEEVFGIKVETVSDAIKYLTLHDGIHFHAIFTLKRILEKR
jgi:hypothetical protein